MLLNRISEISGKIHTMNLPMTKEEFDKAYTAWTKGGKLIQQAFPKLSPEQREFILTGTTPQEWNIIFPPEVEE